MLPALGHLLCVLVEGQEGWDRRRRQNHDQRRGNDPGPASRQGDAEPLLALRTHPCPYQRIAKSVVRVRPRRNVERGMKTLEQHLVVHQVKPS
jgi:hypothetical protein